MFETISTPKDLKKLAILKKFLESEQFDDEERKDINRLVKRNLYWEDPDDDLLQEHDFGLIDET
jgi:hypothetical protein